MEVREERVEEICRNQLVGSLELWNLDSGETFIQQAKEYLLFEGYSSGH